MNDLTLWVNQFIRAFVEEIAEDIKDFNNLDIRYIDTDPVFEGHRFCEPGIKEPAPSTPGNYFFHLYDQDLSPEGELWDNLPFWPNGTDTDSVLVWPEDKNAVGAASLPTPESCMKAETIKENDPAHDFMTFGDQLACAISMVLHDHPEMTLQDSNYPEAQGSDYSQAAYARIFHPKSKGHAGVKDLVLQAIKEAGIDRSSH
jgi:hypothetical protein